MKKKFLLSSILLLSSTLCAFIFVFMGCGQYSYKTVFTNFKMYAFKNPDSIDVNSSFKINAYDTVNYNIIYFFGSLKYEKIFTSNKYNLSGNSAYASKSQETHEQTEKIKDIKIYSLYNYNNGIIAHQEISNQCFFNKKYYKDSVIYWMNKLNATYLQQINFDFVLESAPSITSLQQLALEIITEDNSIFRDTTVAFYIKP